MNRHQCTDGHACIYTSTVSNLVLLAYLKYEIVYVIYFMMVYPQTVQLYPNLIQKQLRWRLGRPGSYRGVLHAHIMAFKSALFTTPQQQIDLICSVTLFQYRANLMPLQIDRCKLISCFPFGQVCGRRKIPLFQHSYIRGEPRISDSNLVIFDTHAVIYVIIHCCNFLLSFYPITEF